MSLCKSLVIVAIKVVNVNIARGSAILQAIAKEAGVSRLNHVRSLRVLEIGRTCQLILHESAISHLTGQLQSLHQL